jgi:hypothetical protein
MLTARVVLLLCVLPLTTTVAASQPDITMINGVPILIRVVEVRGNPQQVAAGMLARWRSHAPGGWTHVEALRQRTIIAQRRGPLHVAALLSGGSRPNSTRVLVSVIDLRLRKAPRPAPVAVHGAGHGWISVTETAPGLNEHLGFTATSLPDARRGWTAALQRAGFVVSPVGASRLEAQHGNQSFSVFLRPVAGGTVVVLQRREVSP